jgi:hypothetical protein
METILAQQASLDDTINYKTRMGCIGKPRQTWRYIPQPLVDVSSFPVKQVKQRCLDGHTLFISRRTSDGDVVDGDPPALILQKYQQLVENIWYWNPT